MYESVPYGNHSMMKAGVAATTEHPTSRIGCHNV